MPLGTNHVTLTRASASVRTRSNSAFIRELWSDEIIAAYKSNFVLAPLVVNMNHVGKKGDTVHVPRPVRGEASQKVAETQVTLIANQELQTPYLIDQHWEYSRLIEDIVSVQAEDTLRQFYTDDAGYALAKRVDTFLHQKGARLAGADAAPTVLASSDYAKAVVGTPVTGELVAWDPTAASGTGNATTISDEGWRLMVQKLDDNDVPGMGRVAVVPPVEKRKYLGIARQVEFDKVGEAGAQNKIRNGFIGPAYGIDFYVSTNCQRVEDDDSNFDQIAALVFQKEAMLLIEQLRPRTQTQYKQEYLSDLFTADNLFGGGVLRPEGGITVIVPA
jgi:hypothetical protein